MGIDTLGTIKRLLTLVVLIAFVGLLLALKDAGDPVTTGTVLLGFILLAAYLAGAAAAGMGLPRITGYVLLGILVGPFTLGLLSIDMVASLRTIDDLALALIALTAGGEIKIAELRSSIGPIAGLATGVLVVVIAGMTLLVLAVKPLTPLLAGETWGFTLAVALLLAIWCANSSPDATIAVINETGARGPLTETVLGATILKDVLVIVLFATALSIARPLTGGAGFDAGIIGVMGWEVFGSLLVGGLLGWAFATYLEWQEERGVLTTLLFSYLLVLLAHALHVELLLTAVAAGLVIENFSAAGDRLIDAIEANSLVVFAIFFALAGAALDLRTVVALWPAALVIVVARGIFTWMGARLGAHYTGSPAATARLGWMGLISQAGVTLGLSLLVSAQFPGWGDTFVALTTAVIIIHLVMGPILLKIALIRAGEVEGESAPRRPRMLPELQASPGASG